MWRKPPGAGAGDQGRQGPRLARAGEEGSGASRRRGPRALLGSRLVSEQRLPLGHQLLLRELQVGFCLREREVRAGSAPGACEPGPPPGAVPASAAVRRLGALAPWRRVGGARRAAWGSWPSTSRAAGVPSRALAHFVCRKHAALAAGALKGSAGR